MKLPRSLLSSGVGSVLLETCSRLFASQHAQSQVSFRDAACHWPCPLSLQPRRTGIAGTPSSLWARKSCTSPVGCLFCFPLFVQRTLSCSHDLSVGPLNLLTSLQQSPDLNLMAFENSHARDTALHRGPARQVCGCCFCGCLWPGSQAPRQLESCSKKQPCGHPRSRSLDRQSETCLPCPPGKAAAGS